MLKDLMDELQLSKKMSVTSICHRMGISRQTYYHWIDGNHCPTFKNIISLAECFADDTSEQQKIAEKNTNGCIPNTIKQDDKQCKITTKNHFTSIIYLNQNRVQGHV